MVLNDKLNETMNKLVGTATCGLNYAVIYNNDIYTDSLGLKSKYIQDLNGNIVEKSEKNDINTLYDIASLTKVVSTVPILLRLLEKGYIKLTDKVYKYLINFPDKNTTIFELMTHTSGLPADMLESKRIVNKSEILNELYSISTQTNKGKIVYSDVGYIWLGLLIEQVCDKSLDKVFEQEVSIPLGLNNTGYNPKNINLVAPTEITHQRGVVRGIVHDEKACSLNGVAGNAGIFTDIHDMIKFVNMILNDGIVNGNIYLHKESIDLLFTELVLNEKEKRSFSWFVGKNPVVINKEYTISFSGFTGPSISIDRQNKAGIIMLTNRIHPTRTNRLLATKRSEISAEIYEILNRKYKKY